MRRSRRLKRSLSRRSFIKKMPARRSRRLTRSLSRRSYIKKMPARRSRRLKRSLSMTSLVKKSLSRMPARSRRLGEAMDGGSRTIKMSMILIPQSIFFDGECGSYLGRKSPSTSTHPRTAVHSALEKQTVPGAATLCLQDSGRVPYKVVSTDFPWPSH